MKHSSLFIAVLLTLGLVSCNQNVPEWREQYREATYTVVNFENRGDIERVVLFQTGQDEYRIRDLSTGGTCREFIFETKPYIILNDDWILLDWKWNLAVSYNNVLITMPWEAVRHPDATYARSDIYAMTMTSNVIKKYSIIKRSKIDRYLGITPAPAADYPGPWGRTSGGISTDHLAPVYLNRYYSTQNIPEVIDQKGDWKYTKEDFLKERKRQDSLQNVYVKRLVTLINEGDADIVFPLISE